MLGAMYIGVLQELCGDNRMVYDTWRGRLKGVAGTSAGAIVAFMLAAGASPWTMQDLLATYNLGAIVQDAKTCAAQDMLLQGGLCSGKALDDLLQHLVGSATGNPHITLGELQRRPKAVSLAVAVTNAATGAVGFLTAESHVDVPVWRALRASASVPGLFPAVVLPDGSAYHDGGVTCNLPCHLFPPRHTLTLMVHVGAGTPSGASPWSSPSPAPGAAASAAAPAPTSPTPAGALGIAEVMDMLMVVASRALRIVQWYMCASQVGPMRSCPVLGIRCVPCVAVTASDVLGPTGAFAFQAGTAATSALVADGKRCVRSVIARDNLLVLACNAAVRARATRGTLHRAPPSSAAATTSL